MKTVTVSFLLTAVLLTATLRAQEKPRAPEQTEQNIELTFYLMSALSTPSAAPIPAELEPVLKQLRSMFSYKGYQLIDTQVIRTRAGRGANLSAVVDNKSAAAAKTISQIKFRSATPVTDEKGRVIRIDLLQVGLKVPVPSGTKGGFNYIDTGITTDVDIREGQKVVIGKVNMDGSDRAGIVVLSAKLVE